MKKEKVLTSADVANDELVAGLVSTLNESAQVAWFLKAVNYLDNGVVSVRGLKATINKATDSTWLKESHVPYFKTAHLLRAKSGGDKVALKKVITTVQDAKRAWKADEFAQKFDSAKTFKEFADSIPARDKTRGANKKTASEKTPEIIANLTADEIIERTIISLGELDAPVIENVEIAEKLYRALGVLIKNAKRAQTPAHPAGAKVSA